ncbi:MAG: hypothetical protein PF568_05140, partial [Deltaproteobacteria bacterium]|nr:hypothetical protein [Deltaproteobacteria bacterium]
NYGYLYIFKDVIKKNLDRGSILVVVTRSDRVTAQVGEPQNFIYEKPCQDRPEDRMLFFLGVAGQAALFSCSCPQAGWR